MDKKPAGPCLLVMFGASGDLVKRKLIPSLCHLVKEKLLPEEFAVIGFARSDFSDKEYRARLRREIEPHDRAAWKRLEKRLYYCPGDIADAASFAKLGLLVDEKGREHGTGGNVLFYMATAPEFFAPIAERCAAQGLASEDGRWRRFIVEKPFGLDLASAQALNARLLAVLKESQIYRIDHYLGKETVQNLLVLRFGNGIFEPIWNRRYIDHVQITVGETLGVEARGPYYEQTGALRDMVPNHIFQLITLTAMEPPVSFDADALRDEQVKVLRAFEPFTRADVLKNVVRGQYGKGTADGKRVPAYRAEPKVARNSNTETFTAMKIHIENWRWNGVPFFFRTGKRLPCHSSEIVIQFKRVPHVLFRTMVPGWLPPNQLVIRIQPNEGIALSFQAKVPGQTLRLETVDMDFRYKDYFGVSSSTGYERLLYDAMQGDASLFKRSDMLEASWRFVAPVLDLWSKTPPRDFPNYAAGTWGPAKARELLGAPWRNWRECAG
jgi:glucose-6-phosphate 1-dehydrogenase